MMISPPIDPGPSHPDAGQLLAGSGNIVGFNGKPIIAGSVFVRREVAQEAEGYGWRIVRLLPSDPDDPDARILAVIKRD